MLELARERHPEIEFSQADICDYPLNKHYDFITAWDSIWHVPLGEQAKVMSKLANALNPGGVLIFTFGGLDTPSEHRDSSMGVEVYYATLSTEGFLKLLMELGMSIRHLEFNQHPDLHTYCIAQKPLTLQQE